jgi:hypothetical protein
VVCICQLCLLVWKRLFSLNLSMLLSACASLATSNYSFDSFAVDFMFNAV